MKLQLRELKATRPTMPSQGLGPRQSVLPLLISFLFSHIVLAALSFPPRRPPHILLFPPSFLFPSSFFLLFFFPFPLHISPRGLSLSPGLRLISHRGNPRVRFAPRGRKFLFPFLATASLLSHLRDRSATWLRPANPHLLILPSCALLSY